MAKESDRGTTQAGSLRIAFQASRGENEGAALRLCIENIAISQATDVRGAERPL